MLMDRPEHDLTWRAIRRRWASAPKQRNHIVKHPDDHYHKSPSAPLLNNVFELLPNNVINIDADAHERCNGEDKQRSGSVIDESFTEISTIERSPHYADLSKVLHSADTEMIRSELRIIIGQLAMLTRSTRQQGENDSDAQEWKFVAMVLDRLCLIIFTIAMVGFTLYTVLSTPNIFKLR